MMELVVYVRKPSWPLDKCILSSHLQLTSIGWQLTSILRNWSMKEILLIEYGHKRLDINMAAPAVINHRWLIWIKNRWPKSIDKLFGITMKHDALSGCCLWFLHQTSSACNCVVLIVMLRPRYLFFPPSCWNYPIIYNYYNYIYIANYLQLSMPSFLSTICSCEYIRTDWHISCYHGLLRTCY